MAPLPSCSNSSESIGMSFIAGTITVLVATSWMLDLRSGFIASLLHQHHLRRAHCISFMAYAYIVMLLREQMDCNTRMLRQHCSESSLSQGLKKALQPLPTWMSQKVSKWSVK